MVSDKLEEDTGADFYVVPLSGGASPDILRALLEDVLDTLSFHFRKFPTLPADGANCLEPWPQAYAEDCAIVLPLKHCDFVQDVRGVAMTRSLWRFILLSIILISQKKASKRINNIKRCVMIAMKSLRYPFIMRALRLPSRRGAPLA